MLAFFLNYDVDEYSHGYGQINEASGALTKYDILKLFKPDHEFRSSNVRVDDVANNLCVFHTRFHENFKANQPVKVEFDFYGVAPNDINRSALVLTIEILSTGIDGWSATF